MYTSVFIDLLYHNNYNITIPKTAKMIADPARGNMKAQEQVRGCIKHPYLHDTPNKNVTSRRDDRYNPHEVHSAQGRRALAGDTRPREIDRGGGHRQPSKHAYLPRTRRKGEDSRIGKLPGFRKSERVSVG